MIYTFLRKTNSVQRKEGNKKNLWLASLKKLQCSTKKKKLRQQLELGIASYNWGINLI